MASSYWKALAQGKIWVLRVSQSIYCFDRQQNMFIVGNFIVKQVSYNDKDEEFNRNFRWI